MAEAAPDWTPYRFGFNNPNNFADPLGLMEESGTAPPTYTATTDAIAVVRPEPEESKPIQRNPFDLIPVKSMSEKSPEKLPMHIRAPKPAEDHTVINENLEVLALYGGVTSKLLRSGGLALKHSTTIAELDLLIDYYSRLGGNMVHTYGKTVKVEGVLTGYYIGTMQNQGLFKTYPSVTLFQKASPYLKVAGPILVGTGVGIDAYQTISSPEYDHLQGAGLAIRSTGAFVATKSLPGFVTYVVMTESWRQSKVGAKKGWSANPMTSRGYH